MDFTLAQELAPGLTFTEWNPMLLDGCVKQGSLVALQCTLATEWEDSTV